MTPDGWRDIEALFHAVQECPPHRRAELLAGAEPDVRRQVESLLALRSREGPLDRFAVDLIESAGGNISGTEIISEPVLRLEPGMSLGPYSVVSTIGRGGMGEVYRARDTKLDRDVAIKVLPSAFMSDPERVARFQREAKTLAALNHPNIAAIYGLDERDGTTALVLELVEGPTLADRLAQGPVPLEDALPIATQVAGALEAAHERGIIHRDLKPENIKLRPDGAVKVLDFGLATRPLGIDAHDDIAPRGRLTRDGVILGTVGYMSPEQAAGKPADLASDQFSFGVILFELLTGRRPFERDTSVETLAAIIRDNPPSLQTLNPAVPAQLQHIVERCLRKNPGDRYAETRELAVQVRAIRDGQNGGAPQLAGPALTEATVSSATVPVAVPPARGVTRRRALWLTGGVVSALATAIAAWQLWPADTGVRVLAVLPFVNAAEDPDLEYLCDGITESLIQQISRLPSLTVMARSTVFNFKNKPIDPREAGRQLGVDAILTGSVSQRSGRLRITAELVEVLTGVQLWGNTYDRAGAEVVSVQEEIASAIMNEGIRLRLSGDERRALARHPTNDPEAYEWYLRARHAVLQQTEEGTLQARELLTRATARDPEFVLAYSALAATYIAAAVDGFERPVEAIPEARRLLRRALDLDPQLPDAHGPSAAVAFFFDWDWAAAEREWNVLNQFPSGALPIQELVAQSLARWVLSGPADGLRVVRKLREADPLTVSYAVLEADYLFHSGQLDAAAALYEKTLQDMSTANALFGLAEVRRAQSRFDEALDARRRAHEAAGDDSLLEAFDTARGAEGYRLVERTAVQSELEALRARATTAYVSPLDFARAHAQLGNREPAFSYFDAAFADRAPGLVFLKVDRAWDAIRDDPRFAAAVRRVGLP